MQSNFFRKKRRGFALRNRWLLILLLFGLSLPCFSQSYSFSFKSSPLENVLKEIERKSPYHFVYTKEVVQDASPVTLSVTNGNMESILQQIFQNQNLIYSSNKNYIILSKRAEANTNNVLLNTTGLLVTGKVVNEGAEPVANATLHVENTDLYTASSSSGTFELKMTNSNAVLVVSSVGYNTLRLPLNGKTLLTIKLTYAVNVMDETIIKGYYTTSKRLNTGAVSKVSSEDIIKQPVSNPLAALEGRVPGLFIRQGNGLPGSNFTLLIRGQNSLRSGTAPLYIIDGVPFPISSVSQRGASLNSNNPFNTLSPSDIESIEILKDADAIAIYGSRGANGVILITTKKAKITNVSLEVNFYQGWGRITRTMDYLNTPDYLAMRREALKNDGQAPTVANAPDLLAWDTTHYTDWKKILIGGTARTTNAQVRYSGGSEYTRFSFNSNYYRESTVFPGDFADNRMTSELNVTQSDQSNRFHASFTTSYAYEQNNLLSQDLSGLLTLPPNAPRIYDSLGRLNWSEGGVNYSNPFAALLRTYKGRSRRWTSSIGVSYKLWSFASIKINGGYNSFLFDETLLGPKAAQNPANNPVGFASFGNNDFSGWILEPQVDYNHSIGVKGAVEALVGTTLQKNNSKSTIIDGAGYTNDALLNSISGAASITANNSFTEYKYEALFARLNYNYDKKYLLNLTGRRDGSSRFGPGRQFANFGAVGFGWVFSTEKWLHAALPAMNFGKLRGSYGTAGNDQIGDYQYLDTWTTTVYPYGGSIGLAPTRLFNADYSWELNKKLNIGFETGWWNNRLSMTIDWYRNISKNQLISTSLPSQTGFISIVENFPGVVENKGWEIDLQAIPTQNASFHWTVGVNLTIAKNKLVSFPNLESSSFANTYRIGKPLAARIGYRYLGLDPQTGVYLFDDINKDGQLNAKDYTYVGTTNPRFYGGVQNSFLYKRWSLSFLLQFTDQQNLHPVLGTFQQVGSRTNQPQEVMNRWTKPGEVALYEKFTQLFGSAATSAALLMSQSDAALTNAAFIRVKNAALSYEFWPKLLRRLKMRKARLFAQAQNLFTFTHYKGADPENISGLPPLRVITIGANLSF